ncbi:hypothetical protein HPB51_001904 [Rhipicephalus microplus]|uniref:Uncharacterized protein n=1 Tax=Rhipicephalus microplus TaxID=6941 RepID=A0A9J6DEB1_RHIMP|nr:hypothetical protein HPB51_001904 [Rhipicephalus microplus]
MIRQIVREELGRRDVANPSRAHASNASPPYNAMCAAVDATLYDVPQSRAPEPPLDNLHHRRCFQNASCQPPTMVSSCDDHGDMAPRGMFGDVREAPVCYNYGFRGHVARFCGQRHRPQQRYYEGPSASSRPNRWHGGMHSMRDALPLALFEQSANSFIASLSDESDTSSSRKWSSSKDFGHEKEPPPPPPPPTMVNGLSRNVPDSSIMFTCWSMLFFDEAFATVASSMFKPF